MSTDRNTKVILEAISNLEAKIDIVKMEFENEMIVTNRRINSINDALNDGYLDYITQDRNKLKESLNDIEKKLINSISNIDIKSQESARALQGQLVEMKRTFSDIVQQLDFSDLYKNVCSSSDSIKSNLSSIEQHSQDLSLTIKKDIESSILSSSRIVSEVIALNRTQIYDLKQSIQKIEQMLLDLIKI